MRVWYIIKMQWMKNFCDDVILVQFKFFNFVLMLIYEINQFFFLLNSIFKILEFWIISLNILNKSRTNTNLLSWPSAYIHKHIHIHNMELSTFGKFHIAFYIFCKNTIHYTRSFCVLCICTYTYLFLYCKENEFLNMSHLLKKI